MSTNHSPSVTLFRQIGSADVEAAISRLFRIAARRYEIVVACRNIVAQIMSSEAVRPTPNGRNLD
jgi:hypothetical protein